MSTKCKIWVYKISGKIEIWKMTNKRILGSAASLFAFVQIIDVQPAAMIDSRQPRA
jgi:hypothetical protein